METIINRIDLENEEAPQKRNRVKENISVEVLNDLKSEDPGNSERGANKKEMIRG